MRRVTFFLTPVAVAAVSIAAFGGISGTAHDFSGQAWNSSGEICLPCHTPHNSETGAGGESMVLWNHAITAETFTMYSEFAEDDAARVADRDQDADVLLGSPSKLCLSCHDGVTALDAYGGAAGDPGTVVPASASMGIDLRDDHPIGIQYPTDFATYGYKDPSGLAPVRLVDWSGTKVNRVECTSCHEPHDDGFAPFLRMSNAASALCLKCHDK